MAVNTKSEHLPKLTLCCDVAMMLGLFCLSGIYATTLVEQLTEPSLPEPTTRDNINVKRFDMLFIALSYLFLAVYLFRVSSLPQGAHYNRMKVMLLACFPFVILGALTLVVAECCLMDLTLLQCCLDYSPLVISLYLAVLMSLLGGTVLSIFWLINAYRQANLDAAHLRRVTSGSEARFLERAGPSTVQKCPGDV